MDCLKGCPALDVKRAQWKDYPPGFSEAEFACFIRKCGVNAGVEGDKQDGSSSLCILREKGEMALICDLLLHLDMEILRTICLDNTEVWLWHLKKYLLGTINVLFAYSTEDY